MDRHKGIYGLERIVRVVRKIILLKIYKHEGMYI